MFEEINHFLISRLHPAAVFNFLITIKIKMNVAIGTDGFNFAVSV